MLTVLENKIQTAKVGLYIRPLLADNEGMNTTQMHKYCGKCAGLTREQVIDDITCRLGYCYTCHKYGPFVITLPAKASPSKGQR